MLDIAFAEAIACGWAPPYTPQIAVGGFKNGYDDDPQKRRDQETGRPQDRRKARGAQDNREETGGSQEHGCEGEAGSAQDGGEKAGGSQEHGGKGKAGSAQDRREEAGGAQDGCEGQAGCSAQRRCAESEIDHPQDHGEGKAGGTQDRDDRCCKSLADIR